jgi:hypothetical protein
MTRIVSTAAELLADGHIAAKKRRSGKRARATEDWQ